MQYRNARTGDTVTVFGPVADAYASRPGWEPVEDAPPSLPDMTLDQLRAHAEAAGVDLTGLKAKAEVRSAITAHARAAQGTEGDKTADSES